MRAMSNNRLRLVCAFVLAGIILSVLLFFLCRLMIVEANNQNSLFANTGISYEISVTSSRGEIRDRTGRTLIGNLPAYDIVFYRYSWDTDIQNDVILRLIDLMNVYEVAYSDTLPIGFSPFVYTSAEESTSRKNLKTFLSDRKWPSDILADELMAKLYARYQLENTEYSEEQKRVIAGVRYEMELRGFRWAGVFTFAENVSSDIAALINENTFSFTGVGIQVNSTRVFNTNYAAHLLGRIGPIFAEEYGELKELGYGMNDRVGKDGAEKAFETYLRGSSGRLRISQDSSGKTIDEEYITEPKPGGNVYLTIDMELQQTAEDALASRIEEIKKLSETNSKKYPTDIGGGALVVLDVNTFEVLAMASYPTYSLKTFNADYSDLAQDPLTPMLNRCIGAIYPPASTYKMVAAIAGLEENIINKSSLINCSGIYTYYKDYQPRCWIFRSTGAGHGSLNVSQAISHSCNSFFFEVGRLLGIEKLDSYAQRLGFGEKTGIELLGETKGYRYNPSTKKALQDTEWYPGDTLQTAIGQTTMVTPLQLCCYISTLANGGTLYRPTILSKVSSYDNTEVIYAPEPEVRSKLKIRRSTLNTIIDGMLHVTEDGTASAAFKDISFTVAGKTGSAQVSSGSDNAVFAAFAPVEKPEIAIVVIVEHGNSGNSIAPIARTVFEKYFAQKHSIGQTSSIGAFLG